MAEKPGFLLEKRKQAGKVAKRLRPLLNAKGHEMNTVCTKQAVIAANDVHIFTTLIRWEFFSNF